MDPEEKAYGKTAHAHPSANTRRAASSGDVAVQLQRFGRETRCDPRPPRCARYQYGLQESRDALSRSEGISQEEQHLLSI